MRVRSLWCSAVLAALTAPALLAQPPDLTYHAVTPCVLVDTRSSGGAFAAGETRTYNVAGSCGVPAWSNNVAQAQAAALNVTAITPAGSGHVKAYAADQINTTSVLNFTAGVNTANTTPVALAQTPGVGDIKINVSNGGSHVLLTVVGYYSRDMQTVHVHPVPGDGPASGTRLINALASITDASATKRYVVKVEPGIYDVGATMLEMKPYVDIEGSGQQATVIQGVGNTDESLVTGVIKGASSSELRDLQVRSAGSTALKYSIAIIAHEADMSIRDVTIYSGGGTGNWGIRNSQAPTHIVGVTIHAEGSGGTTYGIGNKFPFSVPTIERTVVNVSGEGVLYGISNVYCAPAEVRDVRINVSGGYRSHGFYADGFTGVLNARITDSVITVEESPTAFGVLFDSGGSIDIDHSQIRVAGPKSTAVLSYAQTRIRNSELVGDYTISGGTMQVAATMMDGDSSLAKATCAGVYNGDFTFYAATCP